MESISAFSISGLLAGVSSIIFGILVLIKSQNKKLGRLWFIFSITAAIWGFVGIWIGVTKSESQGLLAWRIAHGLGVVWIPPLFHHFIHVFLGKKSKSIFAHYLIAFGFLCFIPTKLFFESAYLFFDSFYFGLGGPLFKYYFVWWMGLVLYSHYVLIRTFQKAPRDTQNQIKYFFLATAAGFTGGSIAYLPSFGIQVYPWGNFTVFLYPIIMAYAVVRHNLMDVRFFIRRAGLLIGVYVILIIVAAPFFYLVNQNFMTRSQLTSTLLTAELFLAAAILSIGPFLYAFFVRKSSFFQEETMAGITHELKSPLAMIENALDMVITAAETGDTGKLNDYTAMIRRNSSRLSGYVDNLLHVLGQEHRDMTIHNEDAELVSLCSGVMNHYEELAKREGNSLELISSQKEIRLYCDIERIKQITSNLISNALKFTRNGTISILIEPVAGQVKVSVKDTGRGIRPEDLPYIFDRFYQGEKGRGQKGSGIGLTIAKMWVEAHGGKIWAESEGEGKGAKVTFTLPV